MRGDAAFTRPHANPFARSYEPVELFVSVLLGHIDDPDHPSIAPLVARARDAARTDVAQARALDEDLVRAALRLAYDAARAEAASLKPVRAAPDQGPRWWRAYAGLAALRHRQRAALTLFYVLGLSIEDTAAVLGIRSTRARSVVEAAVAQLVRAIREPVEVRRALRTAGSRVIRRPEETAPPTPARMPRPVVRTLLAPVDAGNDRLPQIVPAGPLLTPDVLEQLEAEGPDVVAAAPAPASAEIIPAARRRRRDPGRARLAWAAAVVLVLLGALVPAGAGSRDTPVQQRTIVGMDPALAPTEPVAVEPRVPLSPEVVVVARGDSLWSLAARHLDDPLRWQELWRLNRSRRMADGARFTSPHLIVPGWRLRLPSR